MSVRGRLGEFHTSGIFAGLTYFFGEEGKPLSARAREDDPVNSMTDDINPAAGGDNCSDVGLHNGGSTGVARCGGDGDAL